MQALIQQKKQIVDNLMRLNIINKSKICEKANCNNAQCEVKQRTRQYIVLVFYIQYIRDSIKFNI